MPTPLLNPATAIASSRTCIGCQLPISWRMVPRKGGVLQKEATHILAYWNPNCPAGNCDLCWECSTLPKCPGCKR